jgi:hypothetical protein
VRVLKEFNAGGGDPQRAPQHKGADCIRSNDNRNERQKRVVDEGPAVYRQLVEAENESNGSGQDGVETEKGLKRNKNAD